MSELANKYENDYKVINTFLILHIVLHNNFSVYEIPKKNSRKLYTSSRNVELENFSAEKKSRWSMSSRTEKLFHIKQIHEKFSRIIMENW